VKKARRTAKTREYRVNIDRPAPPRIPDWQKRQYFNQGPGRQYQFQVPRMGPGGDMYERIEKQMREMQKRIDELERRQGERGDHDEKAKGESHKDEAHDAEKISDDGKI